LSLVACFGNPLRIINLSMLLTECLFCYIPLELLLLYNLQNRRERPQFGRFCVKHERRNDKQTLWSRTVSKNGSTN
jgi:hypothetical protein